MAYGPGYPKGIAGGHFLQTVRFRLEHIAMGNVIDLDEEIPVPVAQARGLINATAAHRLLCIHFKRLSGGLRDLLVNILPDGHGRFRPRYGILLE